MGGEETEECGGDRVGGVEEYGGGEEGKKDSLYAPVNGQR